MHGENFSMESISLELDRLNELLRIKEAFNFTVEPEQGAVMVSQKGGAGPTDDFDYVIDYNEAGWVLVDFSAETEGATYSGQVGEPQPLFIDAVLLLIKHFLISSGSQVNAVV